MKRTIVVNDKYNNRKSYIITRYDNSNYYINQLIDNKKFYKRNKRTTRRMLKILDIEVAF